MPRGHTHNQTSGYKSSYATARNTLANAAPSLDMDNEAVLSSDPKRAMQDMMETIDGLRSIYIEETSALQSADTPRFLNIQDKKLATARKYQKGIEEIMARKNEMRRVDPALKRKLETMQADFSTLASENMDALKRMQRTMERIGHTVRSAAKDAVNKQRSYSYGENGHLRGNENKVVSTGIIETA